MAWSVAALGLGQESLRQILVHSGWWGMMQGLGGKAAPGVRQGLAPELVWKLLGSQVGVQPVLPSVSLTPGLLHPAEQQDLVPVVLGTLFAEHLTLMVSDALLTRQQEYSGGCCRLGWKARRCQTGLQA